MQLESLWVIGSLAAKPYLPYYLVTIVGLVFLTDLGDMATLAE